MESPFVLVCLGLITLGLWIGLVVSFVAFVQLRRTLQAVEVLAYQLLESVEKLCRASTQIHDFANHVRSGWMKAFELAVGAAQTLWSRGPKAEAAASGDSNNDRGH